MKQLLRDYNAVPMYERSDGVFFDFGMREMPMITGIRESFARQGKNVDRSVDDADFSFDKFIICYESLRNKGNKQILYHSATLTARH